MDRETIVKADGHCGLAFIEKGREYRMPNEFKFGRNI